MEIARDIGIGHNGGPPIERLPPKSVRVIDRDLAERILIAVTMAAKRCKIAKKLVLEKRKGGEEGRFLRGWCIWYTCGLGAPKWQTALIWNLDRKQIGQEEQDFIAMLARNEELAEEADNLTDMCDAAIRFDPVRFMRIGLSERLADQAARKAVKTVRDAADALERPARPKKPVFKSEADRLVWEGQERRRKEGIKQEKAILMAVIRTGTKEGATKDERKEAAKAAIRLNQIADPSRA